MKIIGARARTGAEIKVRRELKFLLRLLLARHRARPEKPVSRARTKKFILLFGPCKRRERFVRVVKNTRSPSVMPRF